MYKNAHLHTDNMSFYIKTACLSCIKCASSIEDGHLHTYKHAVLHKKIRPNISVLVLDVSFLQFKGSPSCILKKTFAVYSITYCSKTSEFYESQWDDSYSLYNHTNHNRGCWLRSLFKLAVQQYVIILGIPNLLYNNRHGRNILIKFVALNLLSHDSLIYYAVHSDKTFIHIP